jgi:hypothetical protein
LTFNNVHVGRQVLGDLDDYVIGESLLSSALVLKPHGCSFAGWPLGEGLLGLATMTRQLSDAVDGVQRQSVSSRNGSKSELYP